MEDKVARYSIGWIAPLPLELKAAKAVLDEDHGDIHVDGYIYHGGEIGKHNIVMAVQSKMGTDAASDLAARMSAAFRNIEYFVVVGIGGGVPNYGPSGAQSLIVLGDVVVSFPKGHYGGVIRYDFGAWTKEGQLETMSHTNSPPDSLLSAVNALDASHSMAPGTKIPTFLQEMRTKIHVDERQNFEDQGAEQDRLFREDYSHPNKNVGCENCCDLSRSHMRQSRGIGAARWTDTPKIHYGNIASSNQLQISASTRDRLHEELGVICFEMEGAGVIQKHPCLVIRGICDYSDSHKNKKWQPYAAATAAAYAKELLGLLPARNFTPTQFVNQITETGHPAFQVLATAPQVAFDALGKDDHRSSLLVNGGSPPASSLLHRPSTHPLHLHQPPKARITNPTSSEESSILKNVLDRFLASLPKGEQSLFSRCKSGNEMLKTIEKLPPFKADKSRFRRAKGIIQNFADGIEHFFDAIDIIFQSNSEIAAIAWGGILLVLQLASNFSEFFRRLTGVLQRLSNALPQYGELVKHMKDRMKEHVSGEVPARLRSSLVSVYGNLFQFLQSAARIFTKHDTSNKMATTICPSSFWEPFDSRFQSFLDSMEHHRNLLQDELTLLEHRKESALLSVKAKELKRSLEEQKVAKSRRPTHQEKMQKSQEQLLQIEIRLSALFNECIHLERQLNDRAVAQASQLEEATNIHSNGIKSKLEREQKDLAVRKILQWLSPLQFTIDLDIARRLRAEGTSEWLFDDDIFYTWRHTEGKSKHYDWSKKDVSGISPPNVIWVQGKPGAGKTVLAGATIDHLQENTDAPVLFFFFRPIPQDNHPVYRSILAQILQIYHDDSKILDILTFAMNFSHSPQLSPANKYLSELLQICLSAIPTHFIVFDGIDECIDPSSFGQVFSEIRQNPSSKVVLFSRPNVLGLRQSISASRQVEIGMRNYVDIEHYLERKLSYFAENGYLPEDSDRSYFVSKLARGADGMFLWARLFTDFLASEALSVEERVQTIMAVTMPEKLEVMYLRLIKLICRGSSPNKTFAKWIITWLCFSERTLTARELQETMQLRRTPTAGGTSTMPNFEQAVVIACASLVERATIQDFLYKAHVPCYQFIHITAKEFFLQLAAKDDPWEVFQGMQYDLSQIEYFHQPGAERSFDEAFRDVKRDVSFLVPQGGNAEIAFSCLTYFNRLFPAQSLSRTPYQITYSKALDVSFPLCRYATAYWIGHLEETIVEIRKQVSKERTSSQLLSMLMEALDIFLSNESTIRTWIEASYLSKHVLNSRRAQSLTIWSNQVTSYMSNIETTSSGRKYLDIICDIKELVHFLSELDRYWGVKIDALPSSIWTRSEITAFTPSYLLKNDRTKVTSLHIGNPLGTGLTLSSKYLCKVSENTNDGSMVGSLSIWPSRTFEEMSIKSNKPKFSRVSTSQCASGWIAQYEVWSTKEPCRRLFVEDIPLKEDEIRLQMYQSMWNREGAWTVQFPLSISASLHQFTILRTVYSMRKARSNLKASKESCILPLSLNTVLSSKWTSASYSTDNEDYVNQGARYSYWLKFSNDGQRLLFVDATNAAVYSLFNGSGLKPVVESLAEDLSYRTNQPMWTVEASFHPDLPLVAWQVGRAVFGWAYKRDVHPFLFYETPDRHWSYPRKLEFSNCGRHIVITEHNSEVPIYKPIPEDLHGSLPRRFSNEPGSIVDTPDLLAKGQPHEIQAIFDVDDQKMVSGSNAHVFKDGSSVGLTAQSNGDKVSVHLWRNRGAGLEFEKETWEISQLPNWEDIQTTSASIKLPRKGDSSLTFILNKTVQPENNLTTPHSDHLPAIVRRDLDDIRKPEGNGGFAESSFLPSSSRKRPLLIEDDESLDQPDELRAKLDA
ncbi:hypothetical protein K469DRAFT_62625 [Zopfia rhizophila CBS 207.26]|uniref:NACHT domain-containing protein n=1 Tax=Zopfia rhizophila CBS 207.26 TaxID=1314779 RepID=A0A6A6EEN9_9PEZI|nr:hypothetical protein K469DRAFT_62625 [Zopfia rhizophila CBS 207.26]